MKTLATETGKHGNRLEFYRTDLMTENQVVVRDLDAQLERTYTVGRIQELNDFEEVEIESIDQVIRAWSTGSVWF